MAHDPELLQQFRSCLPSLSSEEQTCIDELVDEFYIDVPYFKQEKTHWSGAAVAQMLHAFHDGKDVSQSAIADEVGLDDWKSVNHETLKEDFARYMAKRNYVPSVYYPGRYVLPHFSTGVEGADFIAANYEMINDFGFTYFRALMVATDSPVMVRLHFHTGMYPMPTIEGRPRGGCPDFPASKKTKGNTIEGRPRGGCPDFPASAQSKGGGCGGVAGGVFGFSGKQED